MHNSTAIRSASLVLAAVAAFVATAMPADAGALYRASSLGGQRYLALNNRGDVLWSHDYNWRDSDWLYGDAILHGYGPKAGGASHLLLEPAPRPGDPPNYGPRINHSSARLNSLNDRGEVAGNRWTYDHETETHDSQAMLYRPGHLPAPVGNLGGQSTATAIGDEGHVVGWSTTTAGQTRAFLARDEEIRDLGTLPGTELSEARDVNASGVAVGYAANGPHMGYFPGQAPEDGRAVLFRDGEVVDLGTLGGKSSIANAINDRGQVVGTSQTAGGVNHAFLYTDGRMIDLGTLGDPGPGHPFDDSGAIDINNLGQVVGTSAGKAFLFDGEAMFDLHNLIEADSGIRELYWAEAINDLGQILAWGTADTGHTAYYVLTPSHRQQPDYTVPEPSTVAVFAALGAFLAWRRLRR